MDRTTTAARHVGHRASQLSGLVRSENAANLPVKATHENDTTGERTDGQIDEQRSYAAKSSLTG